MISLHRKLRPDGFLHHGFHTHWAGEEAQWVVQQVFMEVVIVPTYFIYDTIETDFGGESVFEWAQMDGQL